MNPVGAPMRLAPTLMLLGIESQQVIGLRCERIAAGGPAARHEALLMLLEKMQAGGDAMLDLAFGRFPIAVIDDYRSIVRANIARLSKCSEPA